MPEFKFRFFHRLSTKARAESNTNVQLIHKLSTGVFGAHEQARVTYRLRNAKDPSKITALLYQKNTFLQEIFKEKFVLDEYSCYVI